MDKHQSSCQATTNKYFATTKKSVILGYQTHIALLKRSDGKEMDTLKLKNETKSNKTRGEKSELL